MSRVGVIRVVGLLVLTAMVSASPVAAEEAAGRWALGGYLGLNQPLGELDQWYDGTAKMGLSFTYVASSKVSVEFEYLRTKDQHGSIEDREFTWFIDNRNYKSPDVTASMTWNNVAVNGIIRLAGRPRSTKRPGRNYARRPPGPWKTWAISSQTAS